MSPRRVPGRGGWVVFDWGCVISLPTDALDALAGLLGVDRPRFEEAYWAARPGYDTGGTDEWYWRQVAARLGVELDGARIGELVGELVEVDTHGWLRTNHGTVALIDELAGSGTRLAVLSNAPASFARLVERQQWVVPFELLTFSGDVRLAKPDPRIYAALLHRLAAPPEDCLFVDDKQDNVAAAHGIGMAAVRFSTPEQLRTDLITHGYLN